ncbi:MAG: 16S rRNA (guanine(527)-N(7))-methyltransferase RsmG [Pseudohongiellaceae bacterium]
MTTDQSAVRAILTSGIEKLGLTVSDRQVELLLDYLALLQKWNQAYNLTGIKTPQAMVRLNLLDSLSIVPLIDGNTVLDVGTGAGLPGIVLAICLPEKQFIVLDSNGKKTRFLFQVVTALKLKNVRIENQRAENFQSDQQIDIVVTRAFSSLRQSLLWCGHLLDGHNRLLAMKGVMPEQEVTDLPAGFSLHKVKTVHIPGEDCSRHVLEIIRTGQKQ